MKRPLSVLEWIALRQAARGMVSGKLSEWPFLADAFDAVGWCLPSTLTAASCRRAAKEAIELAKRLA